MIQDEGLADFYARRDWTTAGIPVPLRGEAPPVAGVLSPEPESLLPFIRGDHAEKEASLLIDGIRCASCVWLLEKVLERTRGVISARIGFATHRATVRWNGEKATLSGIIARLRSIGYLARPFSAAEQEESLRLQNRDLLLRFGTAAFFSMQLMILSFGLYAGYFQGIDPATRRWVEYFSLLACTPVLAYSGRPFFRGAIRGIRNGMLNMDVLVSLGAASAYTLSVYQMLGGGPVYFDTAAMIITLVLLGRYLESLAKHRASQAVHRLLALQPREARVVHGQDRAMVTTSEVGKGDLIEIRPGETIPLDGIVRSGATEVDESLVTGESRPAERTVGAAVIGGSMNGLGTIMVEVIHVGQETVLARIADLVERAQTAAMPVQRLADRISAYFVPFVLLLSVATFWYWHRFFYAGPSLLAAVSVLVIACPCALGMATPVAVLAGMDAAARKGILFKGGDVLERMHKVNSIVLDKTGTLTAGKVRVSKVCQAPRSRMLTASFSASPHLPNRGLSIFSARPSSPTRESRGKCSLMLMRSRRCPVRAHLPWWTVSGSSSDGVPCWSGKASSSRQRCWPRPNVSRGTEGRSCMCPDRRMRWASSGSWTHRSQMRQRPSAV